MGTFHFHCWSEAAQHTHTPMSPLLISTHTTHSMSPLLASTHPAKTHVSIFAQHTPVSPSLAHTHTNTNFPIFAQHLTQMSPCPIRTQWSEWKFHEQCHQKIR